MADANEDEKKKTTSDGPGLLSIALVSVGAVVVGGLLLDALRGRSGSYVRVAASRPSWALPDSEPDPDPWGFVG